MKWLETFKSSSEQRWRLLFDDARIHGWSRISRIVIRSRADGTSRRFIRFLHSFDVWYMAFSWIDVKPLLIWIINLRRRSSDDVHSSRGHRNGSRPMVIPYNTTPLSVTWCVRVNLNKESKESFFISARIIIMHGIVQASLILIWMSFASFTRGKIFPRIFNETRYAFTYRLHKSTSGPYRLPTTKSSGAAYSGDPQWVRKGSSLA